MRKFLFFTAAILSRLLAQAQASNANTAPASTTSRGWATNGPGVFVTAIFSAATSTFTNAQGITIRWPVSKLVPSVVTNFEFDHFLPQSLNNLIWTNVLARTNGRSIQIWSNRAHPPGWPATPPIVAWNTNSLIFGMKGATAISPCWEDEGSSGQAPITALTRRHGYARGHGMGPDGFGKRRAGKKIWFVTTNNTVVQTTVLREVVRTQPGSKRDYTILLFSKDLPESIQPMRVVSLTNLLVKYPQLRAPWPLFGTEQGGNVSADLPGFTVDTWKGGDSGSPNMVPLPNELVFVSGRSTSGPSREMQADMDALCQLEGINQKRYQLQWVDLSAYPSY